MHHIDSKHILPPFNHIIKPQLLLVLMITSVKMKAAYFASCWQEKKTLKYLGKPNTLKVNGILSLSSF